MNEEGDQYYPSVAMLADGGFAIAYHQSPLDNTGRPEFDVMARRFDAAGEPQSDEFIMNTFLEGAQNNVRIAAGPTGFIAVWESMNQDGYLNGVFGRSYDVTYGISTEEFMLSESGERFQYNPALATGGDGRFVAVWHVDDPYGSFEIKTRVHTPTAGH